MDYMNHALELAKKALGNVSPNPAVGAVIVKGGKIVGQGYTQPPGQAHAEIAALSEAGEAARGAAMWVTLEPCCDHGRKRTPPCTGAIVAAGIAEVHVAMIDPNPLISGRGKAELEAAGIKTVVGEHEQEARDLNEAFVKHITTGIPFVTAKFAMSLDGKIATRTGDSKWISGEESRRYVHELRRVSDAVMVGANTVLRDNPQLTARCGDVKCRQPLRVIVDSQARMPTTSRVLHEPGKTLIAVATPTKENISRLIEHGAEILTMPSPDSSVDLKALLKALGEREITSVLVEGGGTLLGSLFDLGLVDKVVVFIAPIIIGGKEAGTPVGGSGVDAVTRALRLERVTVVRSGDDIMISGYVCRGIECLPA